MKEFGEPSTKLEFDEFDTAVDGGQPERKGLDHLPAEGVGEDGKGRDDAEGEELGSNPRKGTKPPTVDEYQWQWKVSDPGSHLVSQRIN